MLGNIRSRTPCCALRAEYDAAYISNHGRRFYCSPICHLSACCPYRTTSVLLNVTDSNHGYSWMQEACRATPRDGLHARQQMQGPCYGGAARHELEETEEIGWRWRWRWCSAEADEDERCYQNQRCWYQSYRRSLKLSRLIHPPCHHNNVFQSYSARGFRSLLGGFLVETANCAVQFARSRLLLLSAACMGSSLAPTLPQPVVHSEARAPTAATARGYMYLYISALCVTQKCCSCSLLLCLYTIHSSSQRNIHL